MALTETGHIVPLVHSNGTGERGLLDQYCDVLSALRRAIDAMAQASPHGPDYYPLGDAALKQAQTEHTARVAKLVDVKKEIEDIAEAVIAQ